MIGQLSSLWDPREARRRRDRGGAYKAHDTNLDRHVTLKFLLPTDSGPPEKQRTFRRRLRPESQFYLRISTARRVLTSSLLENRY